MAKIRDLWQGELALSDAFWTWAVLGGVIINAVSSILFVFLLNADHLIIALIAGYVPTLPYNLLVGVGVWRSAGRYAGERHWADLARAVTIVGMIVLSVT